MHTTIKTIEEARRVLGRIGPDHPERGQVMLSAIEMAVDAVFGDMSGDTSISVDVKLTGPAFVSGATHPASVRLEMREHSNHDGGEMALNAAVSMSGLGDPDRRQITLNDEGIFWPVLTWVVPGEKPAGAYDVSGDDGFHVRRSLATRLDRDWKAEWMTAEDAMRLATDIGEDLAHGRTGTFENDEVRKEWSHLTRIIRPDLWDEQEAA